MNDFEEEMTPGDAYLSGVLHGILFAWYGYRIYRLSADVRKAYKDRKEWERNMAVTYHLDDLFATRVEPTEA